jgi:hypothetical protein
MAFNLYDLLRNWENIGFFSVALPFLLIFTLVFAVLQKSMILGTNSKNFNAIVALIIGALTVRNQSVVAAIEAFLPNISMFIVVGLMFLLLIGIFGGKHFTGFTGGWLLAAAVISFLFVGWALLADNLVAAPPWLYDIFFLQDIGSLTFLGVTAFVIWLVVMDPSTGRKTPMKEIMNWFKGET